MAATLTIDEAGQINLPELLRRAFGVEPGLRVRVEGTESSIEIVKEELPEVTSGEEDGVSVQIFDKTARLVSSALAIGRWLAFGGALQMQHL